MESDFSWTWLLLALPLAFGLGWFASRLDLRQLREENRRAPRAYFKGLNHLLNEQQDQAIDAFIEAVQKDPDTTELHFALGNLFRRRGEYQRAVRVHEHLLSRADLSRADRERAQHDLALDYLKAGLLDRAEDAFRKLEGTAYTEQARLALLGLYERAREWQQAGVIARQLDENGQGLFASRAAHYLCEQAAALDDAQATALLREAMAVAPGAARARIELARRCMASARPAQALDLLLQCCDQVPAAVPLAAPMLAQCAQELNDPRAMQQVLAVLQAFDARQASIDVTEALARLDPPAGAPSARYLAHLKREPSLTLASRWLAQANAQADTTRADSPARDTVQQAIEHAAKPLQRYRCAACGFEARQHFWHCPGCQAWDSYPARRVEEL
ncbi:MAG: lipopolysaccharide assembly protein LapB [Betaproteobacteria bacterium]|jgi:lipopolysaccharide assembly protein B|nr:lipopolysaccharide assembly protein LapB [Betaproteobacteria bacterium]NBS45847.1 lipopolysaccharide assembly protein LapB [Betaproteobacteria bacterium]